MKKILGIVVLGLLLSGCKTPKNSEVNNFINSDYRVTISNEKAVVILYNPYISLTEISKIAKVHCKEYQKEAVLLKKNQSAYPLLYPTIELTEKLNSIVIYECK